MEGGRAGYSGGMFVPCVNGDDKAGDGAGEMEGYRVGRNEVAEREVSDRNNI